MGKSTYSLVAVVSVVLLETVNRIHVVIIVEADEDSVVAIEVD
ncbi:unnamed protein product, partial [Rotaria sp. Silwood2]